MLDHLRKLMMAGAVCLVAGSATASAEEIMFGYLEQPGSPMDIAANEFAKQLSKKTGGELTAVLYPARQIGDAQQLVEQTSTGQIQMYAAGYTGHKQFDYTALPYLFDDWDHFRAALFSEIGQPWIDAFVTEKNMRLVGIVERGPRHLSTSEVVVKTPADVKGLHIRAPQIDIFVETWRALGANPEPIPFGELYMALRTGVVNAQENPIETFATNNFQEVQKNLILTGHTLLPNFVAINEDFYKGLSEEHRKAFHEALDAGVQAGADALDNEEQAMLDKMKAEGLNVVEPDIAAFREATKGVAASVNVDAVWGEGAYDKIRAMSK
ncbi:TRAP transporter substrate-binding protein [Stappia indica]|uniref:TRAP transporter substrate-binding protein n=1 Tax=Stappia indica TaxID=538381 RepID=UPI000837A78C|nr:TRAP transporter substrate-binding protein [Stappia indica]